MRAQFHFRPQSHFLRSWQTTEFWFLVAGNSGLWSNNGSWRFSTAVKLACMYVRHAQGSYSQVNKSAPVYTSAREIVYDGHHVPRQLDATGRGAKTPGRYGAALPGYPTCLQTRGHRRRPTTVTATTGRESGRTSGAWLPSSFMARGCSGMDATIEPHTKRHHSLHPQQRVLHMCTSQTRTRTPNTH